MLAKEIVFNIEKHSIISCLLVVSTWLLYPWAISWIFPAGIRVLVLILLCFSTYLVLIQPFKRNHYPFQIYLLLFASLYITYAVSTLIGSVTFHNHTNFWMLVSQVIKIFFLLYLLKILTIESLKLLFNIYSNLTVFLTALGLLNTFGIYLGWFNNYQMPITQGIDFHRIIGINFGGYFDTVVSQIGLYRLQSFAIEPAAYAMAASVALYWLVLTQKSIYRAIIIACGISASWSTGVILGMLIILILLFINPIINKAEKSKLSLIFLLCLVPQLVLTSFTGPLLDSEITQNKHDSLTLRINEIKHVFEYLNENPSGAGFGGAKKLLENPISVGYINVMADSGIISGSLYILSFIILGLSATFVILGFSERKK